jgi:hypothetical protein
MIFPDETHLHYDRYIIDANAAHSSATARET